MSVREFRLFGALREFGGSSGRLSLEIPDGLSVLEFRKFVSEQLAKKACARAGALVLDSAIADDRRILADTERVPAEGGFCLLPPVCGG